MPTTFHQKEAIYKATFYQQQITGIFFLQPLLFDRCSPIHTLDYKKYAGNQHTRGEVI